MKKSTGRRRVGEKSSSRPTLRSLRIRRILFLTVSLSPCSFLWSCSDGTGDGEDAGPIDLGAGRPMCAVDRHDKPTEAHRLSLGMPYQGQAAICPITDRDWYEF